VAEPARVVLITGASSGIGAALGCAWAQRGAHVALAARRRERLEALVAQIEAKGGRALAIECDVTREGDNERAIAQAVEAWGHVDTVVANAGFGVRGAFEALSLEDYRRQLETNVFGLMRTVTAALPELRRARGRLALVGSVAGYVSAPGTSAYAMSKHAVRALAEALWHELRAAGISVTHIAPGLIESEFRLKDDHGQLKPQARDYAPAWLILPTAVAARRIVRAVEGRRREVVITAHGKVLVWLSRLVPGLAARLTGGAPSTWRREQHEQEARPRPDEGA
jgi:short-subunit dehydrogenase